MKVTIKNSAAQKPNLNLKPNHFNYESEATRVFVSKTYTREVIKDELGVEHIKFVPNKGNTMVKPETLERRRLEALNKVA